MVELVININGETKDFDSALRHVQNAQKNLDAEETARLRRVAAGTSAAFAAISAGVAVALTQFAQYESAVVAAARTTGLAGDELENFKNQIDDISEELKRPRESLLQIAEVAGTLGIKGADNLAKFTRTMAQFDIASATLRGGDAANQIARIINLTGGGIENVDRFASEIAYLADNFAATEAEIAAISQELALVNPNFKLTTQNVIGLSAAFAQFGITPEIVRTGLVEFSSTLDKALREGGKELELFNRLTGMTNEQLKETFLKAPEKVFVAFSEGLKAAGDDAGFVLSELGLDQARLSKLFLSSAQNVEVLTDALEQGNDEYARNTKLNEETQKALDTTAKRWDGVRIAAGNLTADLGEKLAPTFNSIFDDITESLTGIRESLQKLPNDVDLWTAQLEAVKTIFNEIKAIVENISNTMQSIVRGQINAIGALLGSDFRLQEPRFTQEDPFEAWKEGAIKNLEEVGKQFELTTQKQAEESAKQGEIVTEQIEGEKEKRSDLQTYLDELSQQRKDKEEEDRLEKLARQDEQFEEDLERLIDRLQGMDDIEAMFSGLREMRDLQELKSKARTAAQKEKIDKGLALSAERYSAAQTTAIVEDLQRVFDTSTAIGKALFLVQKALKIADIISTTQRASMLAYESQLIAGDPTSVARAEAARQITLIRGAVAAGVVAATAVQEFTGAREGGIVQGGVFGRDTQPFMLAKDEIVVPSRLNPLSPNFDDTFGGGPAIGGGQRVEVQIGLDEDASRVLTIKQREDSVLGIQR